MEDKKILDRFEEAIETVEKEVESIRKLNFKVINPTGLDEKAATILSNEAVKFLEYITLEFGDRETNAKSIGGIVELGIKYCDQFVIYASYQALKGIYLTLYKNKIAE